MSLNPRYVIAPSLQMYFVDKDSGLPLSAGKVFFYRDNSRTQLKSVYELQGSEANYTYSPLPNPIILSAVGTIQDNSRNDVIPYYYPFDENGDTDLYYIVVQNSLGVPQFTRQAWPNPGIDNTPDDSDSRFNYIPNGQLLAHTVLPDDALVPGSNIIAQGGFTVELPDNATSVNTLELITQQFTQEPPQSPRYLMRFTCSSFNAAETFKNIRIAFTDVNKFSTKPGSYTFAFWATSNVALPVAIQVYKYFGVGGSTPFSVTQELVTITTSADATLYQFTINFGLNNAYTVGTGQDDYVAIDISLPTNIGFQASFSDFVLVAGDAAPVVNFPVQTDADMMTRGVMGWTDKVDPDGMDLYLPPILTKRGMTWDNSQIGRIEMMPYPVAETSAIPAPQHNIMNCDGTSYISSEFSSNGIPYIRLSNYLINTDYYPSGLPLWGTGPNYVSALIPFSGANENTFRIVYNSAGVGSTLASDGNTGFTFESMYIYGGSTTGIASFNIFASNTTANSLRALLSKDLTFNAAPDDGTSGFIINLINSNTGVNAFQDIAGFTLVAVSGAALGTGGTGHYFDFSSDTEDYRMWFNATGSQTAPGNGGKILIQVNITIEYSAQDVANIVREVLNAFNSTQITALPASSINGGDYFLFHSNPTELRNFYVWYSFDDSDLDPMPVGASGIEVRILESDDAEDVRNKTRIAINAYQFYVPDFGGLFFRCADPNGNWDADAANRFSYTANVSGANPGTFQYQQFLSHSHVNPYAISGPLDVIIAGGGALGPSTQNTNLSGGNETRPVNTYLYPTIRY